MYNMYIMYEPIFEVDLCHFLNSLNVVWLVISDRLEEREGLIWITSCQGKVSICYGDPVGERLEINDIVENRKMLQ